MCRFDVVVLRFGIQSFPFDFTKPTDDRLIDFITYFVSQLQPFPFQLQNDHGALSTERGLACSIRYIFAQGFSFAIDKVSSEIGFGCHHRRFSHRRSHRIKVLSQKYKGISIVNVEWALKRTIQAIPSDLSLGYAQ